MDSIRATSGTGTRIKLVNTIVTINARTTRFGTNVDTRSISTVVGTGTWTWTWTRIRMDSIRATSGTGTRINLAEDYFATYSTAPRL